MYRNRRIDPQMTQMDADSLRRYFLIDLSLHLRPSASSADRFSSSLGSFWGSFSGLIEGSISDSFRRSGGLASFGLPHPSILAIFGGHQSAVTPQSSMLCVGIHF
jgi:hypothetical protein